MPTRTESRPLLIMGAQVSKQVARRLPQQAKADTLANTPRESPSTLHSQNNHADLLFKGNTRQGASQNADVSSEETRDQQLHKNLAELGPVAIEPTRTKMHTSDPMLSLLYERRQTEDNEPQTTQLLTVDELYSCLETRKRLSKEEFSVETLASKYKLEKRTLSSLLKYYNTIAVMPEIFGEKDERRLGVWVDSREDWQKAVLETEAKSGAQRKAKSEAERDKPGLGNQTDKRLKDLFTDD